MLFPIVISMYETHYWSNTMNIWSALMFWCLSTKVQVSSCIAEYTFMRFQLFMR